VNPPSVPVGSANSHAIVTGNNFSSAAAIQWNGQAVATTYDDATKLEFDVPAASLTVAGSNAVTVVNPDRVEFVERPACDDGCSASSWKIN